MDFKEASPLLINNLLYYFRERDSVLAGATGTSLVKGEIPGGRTIADMVDLFQPGGCVSGHVISLVGESAVIELEGGAVGKAATGML